jgi:ParB family chromosome partitioning protein
MVAKTKKSVATMDVLEEVRDILSVPAGERIIMVNIADIGPNPYQPAGRLVFSPDAVEGMANSILKHGLILTPVVRADLGQGTYQMADGWLRLSGYAYLAGYKRLEKYHSIPVIVRDLTDQQMADMVIEANTVRQDLNPIELASFYKKYLEDFKVTQVELARAHNISQGELSNTMRLLELPADIQELIISQKITPAAGRQLIRLNVLPKRQAEVLNEAVRYGRTVTQLDQGITRELWYGTKELRLGEHRFDVKGCEVCDKSIMAVNPDGSGKKERRCLDEKCWEKKQDAFEKARAKEVKEKTGKNTDKILTQEDVDYNQKVELTGRALDEIDNPLECKKCDHTALYKYSFGSSIKPERICLNPSCFRKKKSKKTRDINAEARIKDRELTAELAKTFRDPVDQKSVFLVIVRHGFRQLNQDARKDILAYFPELRSPDDKKPWDEGAIIDILEGWAAPNLARICAAVRLTESRRGYVGQSSTKLSNKLSKDAQLDYAIITGGLADYLDGVIKLQNAQCKGCSRAISDKVGTGKECCGENWGSNQRNFDENGKCSYRSIKKCDAPVIDDDDDDDGDDSGSDDEGMDEDE